MKIEILRNTIADGKPVKAGDTVEVSDNNAKTLVMLGKAKAVESASKSQDKKKAEKEATPPAPTAPVAKKESIEDALEKDPDLGDEEKPSLEALSYEALVEMAADYGVSKPNGMKKAKLIEEIKAAQSKKAA